MIVMFKSTPPPAYAFCFPHYRFILDPPPESRYGSTCTIYKHNDYLLGCSGLRFRMVRDDSSDSFKIPFKIKQERCHPIKK